MRPQYTLRLYPRSTLTVLRYLSNQQTDKGLWLEPPLNRLAVGAKDQSTASHTV